MVIDRCFLILIGLGLLNGISASNLTLHQEYGVTYCDGITIDKSNVDKIWPLLRQCHVIEGNLRFHRCRVPASASLPNLLQVTGFVILERVKGVEALASTFPRLSVIRGQFLFHGVFALILNANPDLAEVGRWSLRRLGGAVHAQDNFLLCTEEEKQWNMVDDGYKKRNVFRNNRDFCPFIGCEEEGSCNARPKTCSQTGLSCVSLDLECHSECLGGCYEAQRSDKCVTCRNFLLDGRCVSSCPSTHLKYMDYRCVSVDYCMKTNGSISHVTSLQAQNYQHSTTESQIEDITEKTVLECLRDCPEKFLTFMKHSLFEYHGILKTCKPRPICESSNLDNRNLGNNLRGCKHVDGNLIIRVSGGKNVAVRLEENLGGIEIVTGYVMVAGANALYSLSFMANLTLIEGRQRVYGDGLTEGYALYVLENRNLREFWDFENRNRPLEVKGPVLVSFNDRLCPKQINLLHQFTRLTKSNITEKFNGRKAECQIFNSVLSAVPGSKAGTVVPSWLHNYCGVDNRYVFGYEIFYRPTTVNISYYHQRDFCSDPSVWNKEILNLPVSRNDTICMSYEVKNLQPNTRYAFYVRSLAADFIRNTIQSNITYTVTRSIHPKSPDVGKTKVLNSGFVMSWGNASSSLSATSELFYEVILTVKNSVDISEMELQPQCQVSFNGIIEETGNKIEKPTPTTTQKPQNKSCSCPIDAEDIHLMQKQRKDNIEMEKEISRLLFHRTKTSSSLTGGVSPVQPPTKEELDRYTKREEACKRMMSLPEDCPPRPPKWGDTDLKFTPNIEAKGWLRIDDSVMQWTGSLRDNHIQIPFPVDFEAYVEPYTIITEVRACVEQIKPCTPLNSTSPCSLCSPFTSWTWHQFKYEVLENFEAIPQFSWSEKEQKELVVTECERTLLDDASPSSFVTRLWSSVASELVSGANLTVEENEKTSGNQTFVFNSSLTEDMVNVPSVKISWDLPIGLEEVALGYRILYRGNDETKDHETQVCLPKQLTDSQSNVFFIPARSSDLIQIGVQLRTPAGYGPISEKCIVIPWNRHKTLMIYLATGMAITVLIITSIVLGFIIKRRNKLRGETSNKYYGVTWLEYIHSRFHLAPNQLHINTDNLLGGGEFGLVYEGSVTKDNGCKAKVAVKTIREVREETEQSKEEKIQALLKEAIIMQNVDSAFVVGLVGVAEDAAGLGSNREESLYVALEFMDGGDLKGYLNSRRESCNLLNSQEIAEIAIQIADGMSYLSSKNYQHRDLAARNCLIRCPENEPITVKIADFGLTRYLKQDYYYFPKLNKPLPVRWMAPEALNSVTSDGGYSFWSDVWSYGVLLYEIATTGLIPYEFYSNENVRDGVSNGDLILEVPDDRAPFANDLIRLCHNRLPRARPNFHFLVEKLLPETSEKFELWFREHSFFDEDEGFFAGSSLDASQDAFEQFDTCSATDGQRQSDFGDDEFIEDVLLTPRATNHCWTLPCGSQGLSGKKKFSFSSDALLYR